MEYCPCKAYGWPRLTSGPASGSQAQGWGAEQGVAADGGRISAYQGSTSQQRPPLLNFVVRRMGRTLAKGHGAGGSVTGCCQSGSRDGILSLQGVRLAPPYVGASLWFSGTGLGRRIISSAHGLSACKGTRCWRVRDGMLSIGIA